MINGLTFTGREAMLTKGVKTVGEAVADKTHEYLGVGKIFAESAAAPKVAKNEYTSPYGLISASVNNSKNEAIAELFGDILPKRNEAAVSYAKSHCYT